MSEELCLE